jgi:hypothetical protein
VQIEQTAEIHEPQGPSQGLLTGLAMIGGLGITLVVLALGLGAAGVLPAEDNTVGLGVLLGLLLLVFAIGGWLISVQPFRHFDDIDVPAPDEHHGHDDHSSESH